MKKLNLLIFLLALVALILFPLGQVKAFDFDPSDIISDGELTDYQSMDLSAITEFLNNQDGILKTYVTTDYSGTQRLAAEIIYNAAQTYKINPKWILATLQKEQSLVTNDTPSSKNVDWAMGYAVCDSCSTDDPQVAMFKGFGTQVDRGTWRMRYYYDHPDDFNFAPGKTCTIDGQVVVPNNQSTANLYNYTPHLHGNFNFWNIWQRWFAKIFPDGTLIKQTDTKQVYLISDGKARPFATNLALITRYPFSKIIEVAKNDLERFNIGDTIKFANFSLVSSPAKDIYLITGLEKKKIASNEVFKKIGYNKDEVIKVSDADLALFEDARDITVDNLYPTGALLQDKKTGGVFYVEDGIKYPVWSKDVLKINYGKSYKVVKTTSKELDKYITAANGLKLRNGVLIKTKDDSKVYVISNGERRWIANESTFDQLGYDFHDIYTITDKVMSLHPVGDNIDLLIPTTSIATNNQ